MRKLASILLLGCSSACYVGLDGDDDSVELNEDDAVFLADAELGGEIAATRAMALPASGWLDHEGSPITPWCGAVLVAPDVVVTAAHCLDGLHYSFIDVGFGRIGSRTYEIAESIVQSDAIDRDRALAAFRLTEPVVGVEPVELDVRRQDVCEVLSVVYRYVLRGEESERSLWSGCITADELRATAGTPNCHGDMGTGAFLSDGSLVGVAVDAWSEEAVCVPGHRLATVADNEAFFDLALDLSRPEAS
ncbi:MAG TPA: trypsin-like serine protease [Nannocystaceae bacterium]|nr:trypsin-like serine protease [Nannocystaceae bacterium]